MPLQIMPCSWVFWEKNPDTNTDFYEWFSKPFNLIPEKYGHWLLVNWAIFVLVILCLVLLIKLFLVN